MLVSGPEKETAFGRGLFDCKEKPLGNPLGAHYRTALLITRSAEAVTFSSSSATVTSKPPPCSEGRLQNTQTTGIHTLLFLCIKHLWCPTGVAPMRETDIFVHSYLSFTHSCKYIQLLCICMQCVYALVIISYQLARSHFHFISEQNTASQF